MPRLWRWLTGSEAPRSSATRRSSTAWEGVIPERSSTKTTSSVTQDERRVLAKRSASSERRGSAVPAGIQEGETKGIEFSVVRGREVLFIGRHSIAPARAGRYAPIVY